MAGKVAVVTGAGDGIGRGIARQFAAHGARVMVADIDVGAARAVAAEIDASGGVAAVVRADVGVRSDVLSMVQCTVDQWGGVDILVNNAWGGPSFCGVEDKTEDQMMHGLNVAFLGPLWAMQASFSHMRSKGWGRIINMVSGAGIKALPGTLEYNAAKEALRTLTRTAAREWAPFGITVNAISPGAKGATMRRRFETNPELEVQLDAQNPMGRVGDPELDVAPVAVFLASDQARYLTGNTLFVDGGSHINLGWPPGLTPDTRF